MNLGTVQPLWFLLLMAIPPLLWLMHRNKKTRPVRSCALHLLILASLFFNVLALTEPFVRTYGPITIALDFSSSARQSPWHAPEWVRDVARARLPKQADIRVVGFAGSCTELWRGNLADTWPTRWPDIKAGFNTNIHSILTQPAPRWLITDGYAELPAGIDGPMAITVIPPSTQDFGIQNAQIRPSPQDSSAQLWAEISATDAGKTELLCRAGPQLLWRKQLTFAQAGTQWITGPVHPSLLTLQLTTHDNWPEDDTAEILYQPAQIQPPLIITQQQPLTESLPELNSVPLMILKDIAHTDLSATSAEILRRYVHNTGGSVLMLGGKNPWQGVLAELSPLSHARPDRPALDVWFIIDASGSMGQADTPTMTRLGQAFTAAYHAAAQLRPDDRVHYITYNSSAQVIDWSGQRHDADSFLPHRLPRAEGPTHPDSVLPVLESSLRDHGIVILLTDGEIIHINIERWHKLMNTLRANFTVVAPRQTGGVIERLSYGHRWIQADQSSAWRDVLSDIVTQATAPGQSRATTIHWQNMGLPALEGTTQRWVESWLKPMAELRARNNENALAATWSFGLGKVTAINFEDSSQSAIALQNKLADEIRAPLGDRRLNITAARDGFYTRIDINSRDESGWINGLNLAVKSDAQSTRLATQIAPGRYQAYFYSRPMSTPVYTVLDGNRVVGRVSPAWLPFPESPAVAPKIKIPPEMREINQSSGARWSPPPTEITYLSLYCWILSGLLLLAAFLLKILAKVSSI